MIISFGNDNFTYYCHKIIYCNAFFFISLQIMKNEHSQLSHEAHACAESIPALNEMVTGVQALGRV